jgi:SAM-dependent methyltransferase
MRGNEIPTTKPYFIVTISILFPTFHFSTAGANLPLECGQNLGIKQAISPGLIAANTRCAAMNAIKTWAKDRVIENAMNDDHRHLWQQLISHMAEDDLTKRSVLDYGCNQGGFLRLLFELKPFHRGIGTDIALDSLAIARQGAARLPLEFVSVSELKAMTAAFDVAFSHEVIYLLPDLDAHAALMRRVLKPGGVYYAAIGCHTGNSQWPRWREIISEYSRVTVQDYSLDDCARAFFDEGFYVSARSYAFHGFVPIKRNNEYFPSVSNSLHYHTVDKTLFRFIKD